MAAGPGAHDGLQRTESGATPGSEEPVCRRERSLIGVISRKNPDFWDDFFAGPRGLDPERMPQSVADSVALRRSSTARLRPPAGTSGRLSPAAPPPAAAPAPPRSSQAGPVPGEPALDGLDVVRQVAQLVKTRCTYRGYVCSCCVVTVCTSMATVLLWSSIGVGGRVVGVGHEVVQWLEDHDFLRVYTLGAGSLILAALLLLDFFSPPHLPGSTRMLWEGDTCVGPSLFALAVVCFIASGFLMAKDLPSLPLLLTVALSPMSVAAIREATRPARISEHTKDAVVLSGNLAAQMALLAAISEREDDLINFFRGGRAGFVLSFIMSFAWWLYWVVSTHQVTHYVTQEGLDEGEMELEYFLWAAPVIVGCSNMVFGFFMGLRLLMHDTYLVTDRHRNQLIACAMNEWKSPEMSRKAKSMVMKTMRGRRRRKISEEERERQASEQYTVAVEQMSKMVKATCCVFFFVFGIFYIAGQLLYTDMKMAATFVALVVVLFVTFIVFMYKSFKRIMADMGRRMAEHPVGKMVRGVAAASWARALLFAFLPLVPLVVAASWLNQRVRRARRLYKRIPVEPDASDEPVPARKEWSSCMSSLAALPLTPRVYFALAHVWENWPWLKIFPLVYVFCGVYLCYAVCPVLLNVLLAWLTKVLSAWPFEIIILAVFFTGIGAFLLPCVPGLTVYIFGGLVLSNTCPWGADPDARFWVGALVNVAVSWSLKLVACAVQQKCIGELLGKSLSIRRAVGVHKPMIRCIEAELRQPGWTVGKVAILCGGPDWPTSVLAGVLRLSLWQCELGTVPIIFFVIPCALTGSFYLKKGSSPIWSRAANLMTLFSLLVSLMLWMLALWAIQGRLEKDHFELERPLPQNAELEWLDFRDAEVARRSAIVWADVPRLTRWTFALGAVVHVLVCHVLCWMNERLFGSFNVSDDIDSLKWYGADGGLFNVWSVATLAVYGVAFLAYFQFSAWHRLRQSGARASAVREVEAQKEAWLQDYDERCRAALGGCGGAPDAPPPERHQPGGFGGDAACDGGLAPPATCRAAEDGAASPRTPPLERRRSSSGAGNLGSPSGLCSDEDAPPRGGAPGLAFAGRAAGGGSAGARGEGGGAQQEEGERARASQGSAAAPAWAAGDSEPIALAAGEPSAWARGGAAAAAVAGMPHLGTLSVGTRGAGLADPGPAPLGGRSRGVGAAHGDSSALAAHAGGVQFAAAAPESATQPLHESLQGCPGTPAQARPVLRLVARWRGSGNGSPASGKEAAPAALPPLPLPEVPELAPLAPLAPTPPSSPPVSPTVLTRALALVDHGPVHHEAEPRKELGRLYRL